MENIILLVISFALSIIILWLATMKPVRNIWFKIVLVINWVWGFPAAVVSNYRRQNQIEKQMQDALIDDTFLDRASRG